MKRNIISLIFFAAITLMASGAFAQSDASKLKIGPLLGLGGEFDGDAEVDLGGVSFGDDIAGEDMRNTVGGLINYDTPVHKYLAFGGRFMFASFIDDARADEDWARNWFFNFDVAPRLRYGLAQMPLEVYVTTPVGLSLQTAGEDWEDEGGVEFDTGVSWNLSVLLGADYLFTDDIGAFVEAGWMLQNVDWEGQTTGAFTSDVTVDGSFSQFALNLGVILPM